MATENYEIRISNVCFYNSMHIHLLSLDKNKAVSSFIFSKFCNEKSKYLFFCFLFIIAFILLVCLCGRKGLLSKINIFALFFSEKSYTLTQSILFFYFRNQFWIQNLFVLWYFKIFFFNKMGTTKTFFYFALILIK